MEGMMTRLPRMLERIRGRGMGKHNGWMVLKYKAKNTEDDKRKAEMTGIPKKTGRQVKTHAKLSATYFHYRKNNTDKDHIHSRFVLLIPMDRVC